MSTICFQRVENAMNYNKNSSLQYNWAIDTIDKYKHIIGASKKIADIGCGDGKITINILAMIATASNILGIDGSHAMINFAKQSNKTTNVEFIVCDINNIEYQQSFDLVFSCCCLHWLPDQRNALQNIYNSLLPGGCVIIIIPGKAENSIFPLGKKIANGPGWAPYFAELVCHRSYYISDEYYTLLDNIGFKSIKIEITTTETIYEDINKFREWVKPVSPFYEHLPNNLREKFLDELVNEAMQHNVQNDNGKIILKSKKLEVYAIK